jgi:hemerythrin superfamily protein
MSDTKVRVQKATVLLREDHETLRTLFASFEEVVESDTAKRTTIFEAIRKELTIHTQIEEEIFYPAVEESGDEEAAELVKEALEDHQHVTDLIEELSVATPESEDFDVTMMVLRDVMLEHAEYEQEKLFPCFYELDPEEQDRISETLAARRRQLNLEDESE